MTNEVIKDSIKEGETRMNGAITALEESLTSIRTGRANPALVERLQIEYYGTPTNLQQVATISVPEPRQLMIRPFAWVFFYKRLSRRKKIQHYLNFI